MPSGYTVKIAQGITFQEFAMDCARAFGACIDLRDEPSGGDKIPEEFKPTTYALERLKALDAQEEALCAMSVDGWEMAALKEYNDAVKRQQQSLAKNRELRKKYLAMLEHVRAWQPPTPDHQGLKDFMESQILESMKFDCHEYNFEREAPERLSGVEWLEKERKLIASNREYYLSEHKKEVERTNERNAWIKALRSSLRS